MYSAARKCNYCDQVLQGNICLDPSCIEKSKEACHTMLPCGHSCGGIAGEDNHLPCLQSECLQVGMTSSYDDYCNICWIETLDQAPCIQLECKHVFHASCIRAKIYNKWPGTRITFGFMNCPVCGKEMKHSALKQQLKILKDLQANIEHRSLRRLKIEGMENDIKLTDPTSRFYQKKKLYAMSCFAYYQCYKCSKEYFGGRRNCEQKQDEDRPANDFICLDCSDIRFSKCQKPEHREYAIWKCRFCCSLAVWFCWGTTHFCDPCHRTLSCKPLYKCKGKNHCPLLIEHPQNAKGKSAEYQIDCGMCAANNLRKENEDKKEQKNNPNARPKQDKSIFNRAKNILRPRGN